MRRPCFFAIAPLLLCSLAPGLAGCDDRSTRMGSVDRDSLSDSGETPSGGWQSAPFPRPAQCERDVAGEGARWLPLGSRTLLEVPHGLGRRPSVVLIYIAFEEHGCDGTLGSGDVALIRGANDERVILQNATAEGYFVRIYIE